VEVDHVESKWKIDLHLPFQPNHMGTPPEVSLKLSVRHKYVENREINNYINK
jgi:hypothetical protein